MPVTPYINRVIHGDCLEVLRELPDKCVDLVLTDPPYGIKAVGREPGGRRGSQVAARRFYGWNKWDDSRPGPLVFGEMDRVGIDRIIFGGNYFTDVLPPSPCWILWDKDNGENDYGDFELAWGSFTSAAKKIRHKWSGMLQENMREKEKRYHPTQKPVRVMAYIIERYTEPGDLILDPFCGSGTTLVAAKMLGRRYIGIEIEEKYVKIAEERLRNTTPPLPFKTEKQEQGCLL